MVDELRLQTTQTVCSVNIVKHEHYNGVVNPIMKVAPQWMNEVVMYREFITLNRPNYVSTGSAYWPRICRLTEL